MKNKKLIFATIFCLSIFIFGCKNEKNKIFIEKIGVVRTINDQEYTLEVGSGFDGDSEIYHLRIDSETYHPLISGDNEAVFGPYKNKKAKVKGEEANTWVVIPPNTRRYELVISVYSIEPAK